jgi:hypothetical protein
MAEDCCPYQLKMDKELRDWLIEKGDKVVIAYLQKWYESEQVFNFNVNPILDERLDDFWNISDLT